MYYLYQNSVFIGEYDDLDLMRDYLFEAISLILRKRMENSHLAEKEIIRMQFLNDKIFWKISREDFGYYYKTYRTEVF